MFQLRYILKARLDPVPQANGAVRFFCDPTFWAKNVVNLGERKPSGWGAALGSLIPIVRESGC